MKRRLHLIWCVALLLAVAAVTAVCTRRARPRVLPPEECSEVYRHYADSPDVSAAYIKDYRVNDTLTLSATVLQAVTDTGWAMLYNDFKLNLHRREVKTNTLDNGDDILEIVSIGNSDDEAVASHRDKYICIFHVKDTIMKIQIQHALIDKMFESLLNNNNFNQL